jgi:HEAT repeat protein
MSDADRTRLLIRLARREVADDDGERALPALSALHRLSSPEVFDRAAAMVTDSDPAERELGVRILRELDAEGKRFRERTVALMRARLPAEPEPAVLRWMVSALGYHQDRESLPRVAALAGHPDARVRFHVAAALPSLADPTTAEPEAVDALLRLCGDGDADIRF